MTRSIEDVFTDLVEMLKSSHEERCPEGGLISSDEWSEMWQELAGELELAAKLRIRKAGYMIED